MVLQHWRLCPYLARQKRHSLGEEDAEQSPSCGAINPLLAQFSSLVALAQGGTEGEAFISDKSKALKGLG